MADGIGTNPPPSIPESVAALARQLERVEAKVDATDTVALRDQVHALASTVATIANELAEMVAAPRDDTPPISWLWPAEPLSVDDTVSILDQLIRWARRIYLRYADGVLPECWLWHPDVIEELICLHGAWRAAYQGPKASAQRAADWHDRQRPGAARRIRAAAGSCSLREHLDPKPDPVVPAADAAEGVAAWWVDPTSSAPAPTGDQIQSADEALRSVGSAWR